MEDLRWPSGSYKSIAIIDLSREQLERWFGRNLVTGTEPGLGEWLACGGLLPSGQMVTPKTVEIKNIGQIYSLTIFGPIMEELIFRQGLYRDWLLKKLPKPVAFTLSVLIFTLLHLPQTSSQFVFYLIGSIAFNYLYDKTECDIRPVILIHIVHNWLAIQ